MTKYLSKEDEKNKNVKKKRVKNKGKNVCYIYSVQRDKNRDLS